jgi:hypothetical protein
MKGPWLTSFGIHQSRLLRTYVLGVSNIALSKLIFGRKAEMHSMNELNVNIFFHTIEQTSSLRMQNRADMQQSTYLPEVVLSHSVYVLEVGVSSWILRNEEILETLMRCSHKKAIYLFKSKTDEEDQYYGPGSC